MDTYCCSGGFDLNKLGSRPKVRMAPVDRTQVDGGNHLLKCHLASWLWHKSQIVFFFYRHFWQRSPWACWAATVSTHGCESHTIVDFVASSGFNLIERGGVKGVHSVANKCSGVRAAWFGVFRIKEFWKRVCSSLFYRTCIRLTFGNNFA